MASFPLEPSSNFFFNLPRVGFLQRQLLFKWVGFVVLIKEPLFFAFLLRFEVVLEAHVFRKDFSPPTFDQVLSCAGNHSSVINFGMLLPVDIMELHAAFCFTIGPMVANEHPCLMATVFLAFLSRREVGVAGDPSDPKELASSLLNFFLDLAP